MFTYRDLFIGGGILFTLRKTSNFLLLTFFDLESLITYDRIMLEDTELQRLNLVCASRWEPYDYEVMKQYIIDKTENINRCRSKLVKYFGIWYFKKMSKEEFKSKEKYFVQKVDGIHTEQQLADFMVKVQGERDPIDNVQCIWYLIPDYQEKASMAVLKMHHSMCDGLAISSLLCSMNMNPNIDDLVGLKSNIPWWQWPFICAALFVLVQWESIKLLVGARDRNPIKRDAAVSGRKSARVDLSMDLVKLKQASRASRFSINDILTATLSVTCCQYFKKYKDEGTGNDMLTKMKLSVPFSLRAQAKSIEDIQINNEVTVITIEVPVLSDFRTAATEIKKIFNSNKTHLNILAAYYSFYVTTILPFLLPKIIIDIVTD